MSQISERFLLNIFDFLFIINLKHILEPSRSCTTNKWWRKHKSNMNLWCWQISGHYLSLLNWNKISDFCKLASIEWTHACDLISKECIFLNELNNLWFVYIKFRLTRNLSGKLFHHHWLKANYRLLMIHSVNSIQYHVSFNWFRLSSNKRRWIWFILLIYAF